MTKHERQHLLRRALLRRAAFLAGAEVVPALSVDNPKLAEQKLPREMLHYRTSNGESCHRCALFVPGEHRRAEGVCRLVAGVISPAAICDAFSPTMA